MVKLSRHYPNLRHLFCTCLGVKNADVYHVINELCSLEGAEINYERVKAIIFGINAHLGERVKIDELDLIDLKNKKVFPIYQTEHGTRVTKFCRYKEDMWFIPDRESLVESFRGKVWLLDFTVFESKELEKFFESFDLTRRKLSRNVQERTVVDGDAVYNDEYTTIFRQKTEHILR